MIAMEEEGREERGFLDGAICWDIFVGHGEN